MEIKSKVGINTHFTNKIVLEALSKKMIKNFENYENIKTEFKFGDKTRFDFLVTEKNKKSTSRVRVNSRGFIWGYFNG